MCKFIQVCFAVLLMTLPGCAHQPDTAAPTVGQQREGVLFWSQAEREARFDEMYRLFPAHRVDRGTRAHALPKGTPLMLRWPDGSDLASYMKRDHIAGVMVLQDGKVRVERYAPDVGPGTRWTSFSVAKSVTSILLGVALQRGDVASLDDRLDKYIPYLHGSAYGEVTVRQLLTMTSGVRWNEDYDDPQSDVAQMYMAPCQNGLAHVLPYLRKLPRQWPAGTHFNYNTGETDLLGVLVQRATGQSLASYLSRTLWQPYGMQADAWWLIDECDGSNTGGSGLSATLADYARIGRFMLDGGRIHGRQVVADAWLANATRPQAATGEAGHEYGYLWWIDTDGSYAAIGIFGQLVYVDPARDLVIAQIAAWPAATSDELMAARHALVETVKRAIDRESSAGNKTIQPGDD